MADLRHLGQPGARIAVRVHPRASRDAVIPPGADGPLRVYTTSPPADGAANAAVARLLARAIGVAPSRLTLIRGAGARDKLFRVH